jgi:urocanate hydratase
MFHLARVLYLDVNKGISRRAWARNDEALFAIKREMERTPGLKVTVPEMVDEGVLDLIVLDGN